jgi:hypothetical protein
MAFEYRSNLPELSLIEGAVWLRVEFGGIFGKEDDHVFAAVEIRFGRKFIVLHES